MPDKQDDTPRKPDNLADAGGAPAGAAGAANAADGAAAATPDPAAEIAALRDKNLRLLAELQNQQKRAQREQQEALRFAEADFARDLLVILDDLERTQQSAAGKGGAADAQTLVEGVRIVCEHLLKIFEQRDIRPIEAAGRPFDPAEHEALMQQPSTEQPAGVVLQELARGYRMRTRVLRPSRVVVSSGPPAKNAAGAAPASGACEVDGNADV